MNDVIPAVRKPICSDASRKKNLSTRGRGNTLPAHESAKACTQTIDGRYYGILVLSPAAPFVGNSPLPPED